MSTGEPTSEVTIENPTPPPYLASAFSEAKGMPPPAGRLKGAKFFDKFNTIFRTSEEKLQAVRKGLPNGILKPKGDMGKGNFQIYTGLPYSEKEQVDALRQEKNAQIEELVRGELVPGMSSQTIPQGVLDTPDTYHSQENARTCAAANFRMVFEAITGRPITETQIVEAARKQEAVIEGQIPGEMIEPDALLNIFQTNAFKEQFPGLRVKIIPLRGADFDDIVSAVNRLKGQVPELKVYCLISLKSEVTDEGWHGLILLSVDESNVVAHDPSKVVGKANKSIPKLEFINRWGKTFLAGDLVIARR